MYFIKTKTFCVNEDIKKVKKKQALNELKFLQNMYLTPDEYPEYIKKCLQVNSNRKKIKMGKESK